eukprot:TRINITY_DN21556_c0_g1_i1.p1 TRINITY_DN21556_c0_g1~~TRINITY_DN21556_c0_g1_i1.p1  ORF type:complete len:284 (+),score=47.68 TRINITY_DN21556_c0_g1_i1:61-852(+)
MQDSADNSSWPRRVGLFGTHNYKPFEIEKSELEVKIEEGGDPECLIEVTHHTKVEHHTACLWFPVSELNGASGFGVSVNDERIVGTLQKAVSATECIPHPVHAPRDSTSLYYFYREQADCLTDMDVNGKAIVKIVYKCKLMPVELADKKWHPCFMLPVASCFPRGVDFAKVTVKMKELIREIYCVDPSDRIFPRYNNNEAVVNFSPSQAISPSTDLFILGVDTGPKIIRDWDFKSLTLLILVLIAAISIHLLNTEESGHDVFS